MAAAVVVAFHGYWDDQGGRAAAGIAKAQSKAKAAADKKNAVERASERWQDGRHVRKDAERTLRAACSSRAAPLTAQGSGVKLFQRRAATFSCQPRRSTCNEMMMAMNTASFAAFAAQRGQ